MPLLLVDHWVVDQLLDRHRPESADEIDHLLRIIRDDGHIPVRFVPSAFWEAFATSGQNALWHRVVTRVLGHLELREGDDNERAPAARIDGEPAGLPPTWRRALRRAIADGKQWRDPFIVVPSGDRRQQWPAGHEVDVRCDDNPEATHRRLLAEMALCEEHPRYRPLLDPWDCRFGHAPHPQHVARLPRPPELMNAPLDEITEGLLARARSNGWKRGNLRFYVPPSDWSPDGVTQADWLAGRAFPGGTKGKYHGPIDFNGRIWNWDANEGHWDVQEPGFKDWNYTRVNQAGADLG